MLALESVTGGSIPSKGEEKLAASVACSIGMVGIWLIERTDESLEEGEAIRGRRAGFLVAGTSRETDDGARVRIEMGSNGRRDSGCA